MDKFPKIWALGHKNICNLFNYDVEITEKIDGSQFVFGWDKDGVYHCRSKGVMIDPEEGAVPDLFQAVVEWSSTLPHLSDSVYYGEAMKGPKHNTLKYDTYPCNHFALFGMSNWEGDDHVVDHEQLTFQASVLECDVVPLLHKGKANFELVESLLGKESYLGGVKAEGVVVKADVDYECMGRYIPIMCGKYVSEEFKEVHKSNPTYTSGKSNVQDLFDLYRAETRWEKAIQHLQENGTLLGEPKDIGALMKRVNKDIEEECIDEIKEQLWKIYRKDFIKNSTVGLPQWYKHRLATGE